MKLQQLPGLFLSSLTFFHDANHRLFFAHFGNPLFGVDRLSNAVEARAENVLRKALIHLLVSHMRAACLGAFGPDKTQITAMSMGRAIANAPRATTRRSLVD
jgi:hypothetical protein